MRLLARELPQRYQSATAAMIDLIACHDYPRSGRELLRGLFIASRVNPPAGVVTSSSPADASIHVVVASGSDTASVNRDARGIDAGTGSLSGPDPKVPPASVSRARIAMQRILDDAGTEREPVGPPSGRTDIAISVYMASCLAVWADDDEAGHPRRPCPATLSAPHKK